MDAFNFTAPSAVHDKGGGGGETERQSVMGRAALGDSHNTIHVRISGLDRMIMT